MSSTRFTLDPTRLFPERAYAPGYEPALPEPEPPAELLPYGDLIGFIAASGLMIGALAIVSMILLWF